jgi:hypothetical protein
MVGPTNFSFHIMIIMEKVKKKLASCRWLGDDTFTVSSKASVMPANTGARDHENDHPASTRYDTLSFDE